LQVVAAQDFQQLFLPVGVVVHDQQAFQRTFGEVCDTPQQGVERITGTG